MNWFFAIPGMRWLFRKGPDPKAPVLSEAERAEERRYFRTTLAIAAGTFVGSLSFNFWWPFMPFYMREIGATSNANALFWIGIASSVQGFVRIGAGPVWGIIADRYGLKLMYLRALVFASLTMAIAAAAHAPYMIVVSLAVQGLFSGFMPAAIALTSVSVPDKRMARSLGVVTGGANVGSMVGPAAGAFFAGFLGYRAAIIAGATLPVFAALWVWFAVPKDAPRQRKTAEEKAALPQMGRWRSFVTALREFGPQFYLAIFSYLVFFTLAQLLQRVTPIALEEIVGKARARSVSGLSFTISGAGAVAGVAFLARFATARWSMRRSLITFALAMVAFFPVLAVTGSEWLYIGAVAAISFVNGAAAPTSNTLIAATAPPARRGTAFGMASSTQAVAFMIGPLAAAWFTAVSLPLGFAVCAGSFTLLALALFFFLREPPALSTEATA